MTTLLEDLRVDPAERALSDEALATQLRELVEAALDDTTPALTLGAPRDTLQGPASTLGRLRGIGVHEMLRLAAAGYEWDHPARDALEAWLHNDDGELAREYERLDAEERASLLAELDAHGVVLRRSLGTISASWMPRGAVRARVILAGGRLVLNDIVDLMLGIVGKRASVALLDVTSSPLDASVDERLGYHALCQTLRTSHAPLVSATLSSATGEVLHQRVDDAMLIGAAHALRARLETDT